jgi:DNA invertase Pin-like site-specific DNA recombinase
MRVGYIRVSSNDQNSARQLEGVAVGKTFIDTLSGKDTQRPQLQELLRFVREGDTVVVHSMDRLARNLDDLRSLVNELTAKKIQVEFVKESLLFTHEQTPMATLLLSMLGAVAEFERAMIRERQREGIALAKARKVYTGRKPTLPPAQVQALRMAASTGISKAQLARDFGITRSTVYRYLNDHS